MEDISLYIIFFIPKMSLKKSLNFKIVHLRHVKIKTVIIMVLKPNSRVDLGQSRVDPGQRKNKNGYYRSFKLDSRVDLGQDSGHE
jgi:hypothetical protein